ncbi:DNA polymerase III subunit chi [Altererythrobacter salegens]|uniref:DNA polymerase III subunit chi n=1 Tax=Croceibacterium salegens TaxID=1737568 RepID=A0A6I4SVI4_9SPHN|nr:DNA polymerase III subunit chi [Croceibacterium salegens]MXO58302.1 DNA polymerase III subunit chi [Croceibacterium salegens]
MQLDFWQRSSGSIERVVAMIAERTRRTGDRLLVVDADAERRKATSLALWEHKPEAFLANGDAADGHAERQPILLSSECAPVNGAGIAVIADGQWRDEGLKLERTIFLFDEVTLDAARAVWRELGERDGIERRYFAQEEGKWVRKV